MGRSHLRVASQCESLNFRSAAELCKEREENGVHVLRSKNPFLAAQDDQIVDDVLGYLG